MTHPSPTKSPPTSKPLCGIPGTRRNKPCANPVCVHHPAAGLCLYHYRKLNEDPRPAAAAVAPQRAATTTAAEKVEVEDGFEWLLERPIERVEPATAAQPADEIDANNTPTRPFPSLTLTDEVEIDWPQLSLPEFFFDAEAEMGLTANAAATPASSPVAGKRRRDVSDLDDGGYGVVDKKRTKWGEGGLMVGPLTPAESLR